MTTSNNHWSRRSFMKASAAALTASAAAAGNAAAKAERPNFVIIVTDQQNIDTIAAMKRHFNHPAHGCNWVNTPNLDRLVKAGTAFTESHSANPVCCPARSVLFTGRFAIETGVVYNNIGIDKNVPNVGQWFEEHTDYDRVYCGKWHAGGQWNYPEVTGPRKVPGFDTLPVGATDSGDAADYEVSGAVEAYIRNHDGSNPFLIVAGLMNPHDICFWPDWQDKKITSAPTDTFGLGDALPPLPPNIDYDFKEPKGGRDTKLTDMQWRNYAYDYYRMIEKIDGDVGRMLNAVQSRQDNTVVIFTADHGEGLGRHRRFQKWHPYEQSVKVPFVIACPGMMNEDIIDTEHLVSGVDLMATVCDYAGIAPPPHARGLSLRPIISGDGKPPWREHVYSEMQHTGRVIRTQRYKFVKFYQFSKQPDKPFLLADGTPTQFEPGRGADYQDIPVRMLFDMREDPWETVNLAEDPAHAGILAEHERILREEYEAVLIPGTHFDRN